MPEAKRLYIITGKGGVGKTSTALALTQYLNSQGGNARYLNFSSGSFSKSKSDGQEVELAKRMKIPHTVLNLLDSSKEYVGRKMKSKTIGGWVVKTPFYKALMSMIPGFNYLIFLGKTLDTLQKEEDLIYVLDSPSSGHALTMLEATKNFAEVFRSGLLIEDTQKMIKLLHSENFTQINILSLPILMAVNEAVELEQSLAEVIPAKTEIFCNNSFKSLEGVEGLDLPPFLKSKLDTERRIAEEFKTKIKGFIKHSLSNEDEQIIKDLVPSMESLV